jgi:hypothetical protein
MLDKVTLNKLHELHLSGMAQALTAQEEEDLRDISFEDRLALLVEAEWLEKKNHRIGRLLTQASFRFPASIENIEWQGKHGMTKTDITRLAEGSWLRRKQNLILPQRSWGRVPPALARPILPTPLAVMPAPREPRLDISAYRICFSKSPKHNWKTATRHSEKKLQQHRF